MSKLHLSSSLSVPIDACTQTFAWIGRKGSGKTYGAGVLAEELLERRIQAVILDTVGNWYGLRLSADGKRSGYDIPVFGGLRQDLPLLATGGELVADVIVETGRSVILDVSQFNFADRKRFAADFGARLWQRKKAESAPAPLHLIIEECQLIVPQFVGKDETRMVHVYEEIIRLGRNYGIGVSMLTQRPQSVNKEVLTQAECIMAFQINGVPEHKALRDWLTYEGGDVNLVDVLPGLSVGTCYLWSPQWLRRFEKVTLRAKQTFDASATPKVGQKLERRAPLPLNVDDIAKRMEATIEKAKADDPKALRIKVAELERQLNVAQRLTAPKSEPVVREVPVLRKGELARLKRIAVVLWKHRNHLQENLTQVGQTILLFKSALEHVEKLVRPAPPALDRLTIRPTDVVMMRRPTGAISAPASFSSTITGPEQRILDACAWLHSMKQEQPKQVAVAFLARYTYGGGAFNNPRGALRTKGLIEYCGSDRLRLTEQGRQAANWPSVPLTADKLQQYVMEVIPGPAQRILQTLLEAYPCALSKGDCAKKSGYEAGGGAFNNPCGRLRSLGLIEYPDKGLVKACDFLFLKEGA